MHRGLAMTQDFSEDGELGRMKKEHSSRHYETRGYTLFGMVVASHVEDRRDLTDDEKTRLIALMEKHRPRQPHVLIEMHVVVSEDTVHDPAAVQHYNDVILIPHLLAVIEGFATGGIMHMCLDGAPTQFDNRWMYLWASKMWTKYGVRCDYVIGCANHNKVGRLCSGTLSLRFARLHSM